MTDQPKHGDQKPEAPDCCRPTPHPCCDETPRPSCCGPAPEAKDRGFLVGLVYGLVPHTFCILFIVLSVAGATAATSVIKRFLYIPYLFHIIVALSFVFATVSAVFYLRRNRLLSLDGARRRWKYLSLLYGLTIGVNLLFFMVVFPIVANVDFSRAPVALAQGTGTLDTVTLEVDIPCPGHAPLIMDELKAVEGIQAVRYQYPSSFRVTFDASRLTVDEILARPVFAEFPAQVVS